MPPKTPSKKPAEQPATVDDPDEGPMPATEPDPMTDDPNEKGEPKSPGKPEAGTKEAAQAAKAAVDEDRAREVPLLETYKAASLQKQADWEKDAKEFFRDEDFDGKRRAERIAEMDKMDLVNRAAQRERDADAEKKAAKAKQAALLAEADMLVRGAEKLKAQAAEIGG